MIELEFYDRSHHKKTNIEGNSFSDIYAQLGELISSDQPTLWRDEFINDMKGFDYEFYSELSERDEIKAEEYYNNFLDKISEGNYKDFIVNDLDGRDYKIIYPEYLLDGISKIINEHGGNIEENDEIFKINFPNDINLLSTEIDGKLFEYNIDLEDFTAIQTYGDEVKVVKEFFDIDDMWQHIKNLDTQKMLTIDLANIEKSEVTRVVDKEKDLLDKDLDNDGVIDRYDADPRDNSVQSFGQLEERDKIKVEGIDKVTSGKEEDADIQTRKSRDELEL